MLKKTNPMDNSIKLTENKVENNKNTNNNTNNTINNNTNNNNNTKSDQANSITGLPIIKEEIPFLNSVMINPLVTQPDFPPYYILPSTDIKDKLDLNDPMTCFCISARHLLLGTSSPFFVLWSLETKIKRVILDYMTVTVL